MTKNILLTAILGLSLMVGSIPLSFAEPPTIEEACELQQNKVSNDCILLQKINELEAELKAKDAELEAKDAELEADVDTTCASIPVVKTGFGLVTSSIVTAFNTTNTGITSINTYMVDPLNEFNLNSFSVDPPNLALGNILPNNVVLHYTTYTILTVDVDIPTSATLDLVPLNINIPEVSGPDVTPFAGIPQVPTIDTTNIDAADDTVQNLDECA